MRKITKVEVDGEIFEVELEFDGENWDVKIGERAFSIKVPDQEMDTLRTPKKKKSLKNNSGKISSPIPGKIISIHTSEGEKVTEGQLLIVVEAMKMQNEIKSSVSGTVTKISCKSGERVEAHVSLIEISKEGED